MSAELDLHPLLQTFDPSFLPIGVYAVTPEGDFINCNAHARRLLHLPLEGPISKKISAFYADAEERNRVLTRVLQAEAHGSYFEKQILHFKVKGRDLFVQNNCRSLRDPQSNEIVGFVGSLVDVTTEHECTMTNKILSQRVAELTTDIGRVLHANSSTLVMVQQALDTVIAALGPTPFDYDGLPLNDEIDRALEQPALELAQAIEKILENTETARREELLPQVFWTELEEKQPLLRNFVSAIPIQETRANTLRVIARRVLEMAERIPAHKLAKALSRELERTASQLERLTALISALQTRTAVIQMGHSIRSLREFVTTDMRREEKRQRLKISQLIETAHKQLAEFAQTSRVQIRIDNETQNLEVVGVERDLTRAFVNLLHNSIKYSWHRDRGKPPWVTIRMFRELSRLGVAFENWGVGISPEEINKNLIFKLGYRGEWSKDRGRLGTGVGLTDTLDVAQKHGGTVIVQSRPARAHSSCPPDNEEYHKQPFITTVTMFLPEAAIEKGDTIA